MSLAFHTFKASIPFDNIVIMSRLSPDTGRGLDCLTTGAVVIASRGLTDLPTLRLSSAFDKDRDISCAGLATKNA